MSKQIKYHRTSYALLSRRVGGENKHWYGRTNYKTEAEARDALRSVGGRYQNVGGITVDFGPSEMLYDYRIVRYESECTVLHEERKRI